MTHSTIYIDNDSVLKVTGLRDRAGDLVTTATVMLDQFVDKRGNAVTGITTPAAFTNLGDGNYELSIPGTAEFFDSRLYVATVSASVLGSSGEWNETVVAKRRTA